MAQVELNIEIREKSGKGVARKLRAAGKLPAVVYGKGLEPAPIVVDPSELEAAVSGESGLNTLITLTGAKDLAGKVVVLKNADVHPIRRDMISADLHVINLTEKSSFMVPVNTVGTAAGQKEGGSLQLVRNELEVLCLPTQVPQSIDIDVTELQIGDTIHIEDIAVPEGVEFVYDVNFTVLTLSVIKVEVEKAEEDDELEVEEAPAEDEEAAE
jgi:large subunit ribosomal protein L25